MVVDSPGDLAYIEEGLPEKAQNTLKNFVNFSASLWLKITPRSYERL